MKTAVVLLLASLFASGCCCTGPAKKTARIRNSEVEPPTRGSADWQSAVSAGWQPTGHLAAGSAAKSAERPQVANLRNSRLPACATDADETSASKFEMNPPAPTPTIATYSIVAFDPATGDLGVAVQSKFFGVGSVVPWAKAGVGAIATQAEANVTYGPDGLRLLAAGKGGRQVVEILTETDPRKEVRQFGLVDAQGNTAAYTGTKCNDYAGHLERKNFSVQGNILAGEAVIKAMETAYLAAQKKPDTELGDWLVAALEAAEKAGGDKRGRQSAALLVVRENSGYGRANDRYIDLRVEDHAEPIQELTRLLDMHKRFYPASHRNRPQRALAE